MPSTGRSFLQEQTRLVQVSPLTIIACTVVPSSAGKNMEPVENRPQVPIEYGSAGVHVMWVCAI